MRVRYGCNGGDGGSVNSQGCLREVAVFSLGQVSREFGGQIKRLIADNLRCCLGMTLENCKVGQELGSGDC